MTSKSLKTFRWQIAFTVDNCVCGAWKTHQSIERRHLTAHKNGCMCFGVKLHKKNECYAALKFNLNNFIKIKTQTFKILVQNGLSQRWAARWSYANARKFDFQHKMSNNVKWYCCDRPAGLNSSSSSNIINAMSQLSECFCRLACDWLWPCPMSEPSFCLCRVSVVMMDGNANSLLARFLLTMRYDNNILKPTHDWATAHFGKCVRAIKFTSRENVTEKKTH